MLIKSHFSKRINFDPIHQSNASNSNRSFKCDQSRRVNVDGEIVKDPQVQSEKGR